MNKRLLFNVLFFVHISLLGQTQVNRPKVGLVLSGGGARGLAHIGVLKAIDKAGLKIDYISGTSLGAVIGALYAIGYSADSIEKIARSEDWEKLLGNITSLKNISIEEKQEYDRYISEFEFRKMKLRLPDGLRDGQELSLELSKLTMPVYNVSKFKDFLIPFQCVATDIVTGESVVLDSGSLTQSLRASMAIPTLFSPVDINGRLLIDGALANNFPVDNVKKMGANIVIGVNIAEPLRKREQIKSITDIIMQVISFADLKNNELQKKNCDLLITPDLTGYYGADFDKSDSIIKRGLTAGIIYSEAIKKLKDSLDSVAPFENHERKFKSITTFNIDTIHVKGNYHISEKLILSHLNIKKNQELTIDELNASIQKLFGTRYFKRINYNIISHHKGNKLILNVDEIPDAYVKIGVNYNSFLGPSVILNLTLKNYFWNGSRVIITGNIGESPRFRLEHYQYVEKKHRYFFKTGFYYNGLNLPLYIENRLRSLYRQNYLGADIGLYKVIGKNAMLGMGGKIENNTITPSLATPDYFKRASLTNFQLYINYTYNTSREKYFNSRGTIFNIELSAFTNPRYSLREASDPTFTAAFDTLFPYISRNYQQAKISLNKYIKISRKIVFISGFNIGLTRGVGGSTIFNDYAVGGMGELYRNQISFSGLKDYEVYVANAVVFKAGIQYRAYKNIYITGMVNAGSFQNTVKDFIDNRHKPQYIVYGYSLGVGFKSIIGPVQLTLMRPSMYFSDFRVYLNIGYNF